MKSYTNWIIFLGGATDRVRLLIRNTTKNVVIVHEFIIYFFIISYFWESKIHKIEKYLLGLLLNNAQTATELKIVLLLKKWSS